VALYVIAGVTFLLLPVKASVLDPVGFANAYTTHRFVYRAFFLSFGFIAVFTFGAIPAISALVRSESEGLIRWSSNLAYLGSGVLALNSFRTVGLIDMRTEIFLSLDAEGQKILAAAPLVMDQHAYLTFGATGFYFLTVGILLFKSEGGLLASVGVMLGVVFELVVIGWAAASMPLLSGLATVGGVLIGPVWFFLLGQRLRDAGKVTASVPPAKPVRAHAHREKVKKKRNSADDDLLDDI
ncbi:MAG TPA: hypothetical protein PLB73_05170, partial [Leptospiraceae bacterium]|nr:hypothetical protein [Leptospiraceae bacterium]